MSPEQTVALMADAVKLIVALVGVLVVPSLVVGVVVSMFQAATQIQEQTLSFLPRLFVTLLTLLFTGHWLLGKISALFQQIFASAPGLIG
ncbi:flagellar biosynthesis protein FliQ [Pseudaeromonas sharmana]|uniref:Flagellar biosynthetic protein FliQ n=1 Tax=Pseudaeromonas sharmana TaxID=328412 RepID=A0ABV8CNT1_9GAMM